MLYVVELASARDLGAAMSNMRSWLDHPQPVIFRQVAGDGTVQREREWMT